MSDEYPPGGVGNRKPSQHPNDQAGTFVCICEQCDKTFRSNCTGFVLCSTCARIKEQHQP